MIIKIVAATRYLVLVPVLGLALAAAYLFIAGGFGMIRFIIENIAHPPAEGPLVLSTIEVVEFVHQFLIGTVLYITAIGLYQLFIQELKIPTWLKIDSTEELETNLIGVTVVVLAVNFLSVVFAGKQVDLLNYGAGIALPIAALALFIGLRSKAIKTGRKSESESNQNKSVSIEE
jgi:uncharacterized membrane protein YqhA